MDRGLGQTLTRTVGKSGWRQFSGPLFRKYVALFIAVVCVALITNGVFEIVFSYREHKDSLIRIQRGQAAAAAKEIDQFIEGIKSQVGWTTQLPWSAGTIEARRFDGLRLLRQVPAITELAQLDASGREQLRVSRLAMDVWRARPTSPRIPNSARRWPRRSITGRSISAANPSPT
jgi:hypothetical protein